MEPVEFQVEKKATPNMIHANIRAFIGNIIMNRMVRSPNTMPKAATSPKIAPDAPIVALPLAGAPESRPRTREKMPAPTPQVR